MANLEVVIRAVDQASGPFGSIGKAARDLGDQLADAGRKGDGLRSFLAGMAGGAALGVVNAGIGAITGAFGALKGSIIDTNATLESSKVSWGVLLGSSEAAEKQLKTLYGFAATTPFEFPEVEKASRLLQTFGGEALNTEASLKLVGDIAAGVGQPFADVAMWTGRMYDAIKSGRPFGEAAARLQEMGAMSGETRARLEALQKEGKAGPEIWGEFAASMGRFGGMMEKQSQTFSGRLSTLRDTLNMFAATAGKPIFDLLSRGLGRLNAALASPALTNFVQSLSQRLVGAIEAIGRSRGLQLLRDAVTTFQQAFRGQWFGAATTEINGFVRLVGVWGTQLGGIVKAVRTLFSGEEDATLSNFLVNMTTTFGRFFTEIGKNIGIEVPRIVGFLGQKLREGVPVVADAVKEWWTDAAAPQLVYWIDQLGQWFVGTALPFVGTFLQRVGKAFGTWVTESAIPWLQQNLPEWINALGTWFEGTAVPFVVTSLEDLGKRFGDWISGSAIPWLQQEWPKFTTALAALFSSGPTVTEVGNAAIALGQKIGPYIVQGMNSGPTVEQVGNAAIEMVKGALISHGEAWKMNWEVWGRDAVKAIISGIVSGPSVGEVGDAAIALALGARARLVRFLEGGGVGLNPSGRPAGGPGLLDAEGRQHGGPVYPGRLYMVGERGPEYFIPNRAGAIIPNAAGAMTVSVVNNFAGMTVSNGIGLEAVAQAAQSGVQRGLRQGYAPGRVG